MIEVMAIILGLDVSTSCTGLSIIDSNISVDEKGSHIMWLQAIEFKHCKTLWDKADQIERVLKNIAEQMLISDSIHSHEQTQNYRSVQKRLDRIVLEEPLMGFRSGMSSAQTITQLMRFNGIVSYIARNVFELEPEYIGSAHARKLCGMKLQRTSVAGPQKEQVFTYMSTNDLKHVQWPVTKSGKIVPWSRDATDAYVIARAAAIEGPIQLMKKTKKSKKTIKV